uniref:glucuronosyltransferase n=1 Tax=Meloidogyne incognita TaxID=6306 RepID=A0A914N5M7_MELIC
MYAGVPLICIPFTGDQFYNASTIEANGVGVYLKLNDIHFMKNLENSLNQILNIDDAGNCNFNSEYSSEAKKKRNEILQNYEHETMEKNFLDKF